MLVLIFITIVILFIFFMEDKQFKEEKGLVLNTLANLVEPKDKEQEVKEAAAAKTVKAVAAREATVEGSGDIVDPR